MKFLIHNGSLRQSDAGLFSAGNRGFRYGDGVFESMRMFQGRIPLLSLHLNRLQLSLQAIGLELDFHLTGRWIEYMASELSQANNCQNARFRLAFYRGGGGNYRPESDNAEWLLEMTPMPGIEYELNQAGLILGTYDFYRKSTDRLSNLKSSNALLYVMASRYALQQQWDDALILNTEGRVVETTVSNLFILKEDRLVTPPYTEGCVAGVMKEVVITAANLLDIDTEHRSLPIEEVADARSIYLTNAVRGLQWVGTFQHKSYEEGIAAKLLNKINQNLRLPAK